MSDKKLLSPQEVADYLGVERGAVYVFIKQGKIPVVKVGSRTIRIRPESVEAFLQDSGTVKPQEKPHTPLDVIS